MGGAKETVGARISALSITLMKKTRSFGIMDLQGTGMDTITQQPNSAPGVILSQ